MAIGPEETGIPAGEGEMIHPRKALPAGACGILGAARIEAFRRDDSRPGGHRGLPSRKTEDASTDREERWLRCARCGGRVTRSADRIRVGGRFDHVFNNPAGFVFEIGCFAAAEGCVTEGVPTLEFTWFSGHSWCFALCGACGAHLGWFFQSTGGGGFYGLILSNLSEERPQ